MAGTTSAVLPTEPHGDRDREGIWLSVGRALSAWEEVQQKLVLLFASAIGHRHNLPAMQAFGSQMNVSARVEMLDYALQAMLMANPALLAEARALFSRVRGFNDRRNDIAHGCILEVRGSQQGSAEYYLAPSSYLTKKTGGVKEADWPAPAYRWTAAQIDRYRTEFEQLTRDAFELRCKVNDYVGDRFAQHPSL